VIVLYDFYLVPATPAVETRLTWWLVPEIDSLPARRGSPCRLLGFWWQLIVESGSYARRLRLRHNDRLIRELDCAVAWPQDRMMEHELVLGPGDELTVTYQSEAGDSTQIACSLAVDEPD
jgi:hypothetical protein